MSVLGPAGLPTFPISVPFLNSNRGINGLLVNAAKFLGLGSILQSLLPGLGGAFSSEQISNSIKLFLLGTSIESGRRFWQWVFRRFKPKLYITAIFPEGDPIYEWITIFLAEKKVWHHSRDYTIRYKTSNTQWGVTVDIEKPPEPPNSDAEAKELEELEESVNFLPNYGAPQLFRWNGYWVEVIKDMPRLAPPAPGTTAPRTIGSVMYTLKQSALRQLIREAKQYYVAKSKQRVIVRTLGSTSVGYGPPAPGTQAWTGIKIKPYRPLDSIVLPKGVLDSIIADARDFISSEEWYTQAGIPYRRGYLFYGPPGTGKSEILGCLFAGALGLELYTLSLSTNGLNDASLQSAADRIPKRGILLIEDIDCAFPSREDEDELLANPMAVTLPPRPGVPPPPRTSVTMSGLLNVLDGVNSDSGKIFMATTNYVDRLDGALIRPGRIDMKIEYKLANKEQAVALFNRFFVAPDAVRGSHDKNPHEPPPHHELADEFASHIPEDELTVAELQGYLLACKRRPQVALDGISEWIVKEREERIAREEREKKRKALLAEARQKAQEAMAQRTLANAVGLSALRINAAQTKKKEEEAKDATTTTNTTTTTPLKVDASTTTEPKALTNGVQLITAETPSTDTKSDCSSD
ncbi:hypothetical protein PC9H_009954 [Pleurotus ostreatus]|uniref:P-loop containing nucleoside triphosphate hydrolase protein n=1 Tax=Pleurotus ostreatus TaxID=5322 RepID=A0A8H7DSK3_PLEOS|nr:uncharacterized protein PC9H_009954 [Pleurotus ostreatus]KAF7424646.1 hypothetical protein PC9H_009954 [Pleurotus ostreatus]